jgi:hypothetical protein
MGEGRKICGEEAEVFQYVLAGGEGGRLRWNFQFSSLLWGSESFTL